MKVKTAPKQSLSEHAPSFNFRLSMDTKGRINPLSQNKSLVLGVVDSFCHFFHSTDNIAQR